MATVLPDYYCHRCRVNIGRVTDQRCPHCRDDFIEEVPPQHTSSASRLGQPRHRSRIHVHSTPPFSGTRLVFRADHSPVDSRQDGMNIGTFLHNVFSQLSGAPVPPGMHNDGRGFDPAHLDAFLTHLLNQMGENSGPAPASESRIKNIPTVKVTAEQAHDSLQCTVCMDDFKEGEEAKRLPCSHHFHEDCISRWLRLHGTCPTCRVTLEGENTSNREYYNFFPNQDPPRSRNDRGSNGDSRRYGSGAGSTLFDFD